MPRRRRKLKDKRQVGLTAAKAYELMHGHPGARILSEYEALRRREKADEAAAWSERRADWSDYGEALLARWLVEHPGTRPAGWWWFDAPGPRRKIAGPGRSLPVPGHAVEAGSPSIAADGTPAWHSGYGFGMKHVDPVFEEQHEYLTRRRLWQIGERKAFNTMQRELKDAAVS